VTFFDDRRWASQERVKREEKMASLRRKKQKKVSGQNISFSVVCCSAFVWTYLLICSPLLARVACSHSYETRRRRTD